MASNNTPPVGAVVFYDAPVYGENDPAVHVGVVVAVTDDRVRVHTLGLAANTADFPSADVRLTA